VSDKAIRNWIVKAQENKSSLQLIYEEGKVYIANTPQNNLLIQQMTEKGRKYRNKRSFRSVEPHQAFYSNYNSNQILDMLNGIEKYHELPSHYRYFNQGAHLWDEYLNKLYSADTQNLMNTTVKLIELDKPYIETILEGYDNVNIIDLGVGNGKGALQLLAHLNKARKLNKYIGIDCSAELLEMTSRNITKWLPNVQIETFIRDISHERFADIIANSTFNNNSDRTTNILLFLGGTLGNFRNPDQVLSTIRDSMGKNDILITSDELDSENARNFHGFDIHIAADRGVITRNTRVLNLMSIEPSMYELEQFFDEKECCRTTRARFSVELEVKVKIGKLYKSLTIHKGDALTLFRMWEWTGPQLEAIYEKAGFSQIRTTKLHDPEYVLMVSKVTDKMPYLRQAI
jgi:uncharacterized SAM-dependent methyltransferase